jgi:hypothetical protein
MKALLGAIKFRNVLAHGHLTLGSIPSTARRGDDGVLYPTSEEWKSMFRNLTIRTPHRKQLQETLAEEEDLERRIGDLNLISGMAIRFQIVMVLRSGGSDPRETLRGFDEQNPDHPRLLTVPDYLTGG